MSRLSPSFFAALSVLFASCLAGTLGTRADTGEDSVQKLAAANNDLALRIYRRLASGSSENVFFSPWSLSTAFAMLFYAAKGDTAQELRQALGYESADLPDELVHQAFHKFRTESIRSKDAAAYVLDSANVVLLDDSLDAVPSYKDGLKDLYDALVMEVTFSEPSPMLVYALNMMVNGLTNGKIGNLVDDLDPSSLLVLLNAVYFKGTWKTKFDSRLTMPQTFYNRGDKSSAKEVPMMRLTDSLPYAAASGAQAVELPYKGDDISMIVILPNDRDGLESLERRLTLEKLSSLRRQLEETEIHLTLPKFKLQYSREMSGDFLSLGARRIFGPGADFSGMTSQKNVYVSEVIHKAVVEVNEEGSEAAAATLVISNRFGSGDTPDFVADHPFLFAIVDKRSDMILFVGRVTNL